MYLAIEGIKGSGKTTIINELLSDTQIRNIDLFPITASMNRDHPLERAHQKEPLLKNDDKFLENLFICRAYWNQPNKQSEFILGDRSILTSYVSRWSKWSDPYFTINKVEFQYKGIRKPDVVIWLETDTLSALSNIKMRKQKLIRVIDEDVEKLIQDKSVYEELIYGKTYEKKIGKTQIIILPNKGNKVEIKNELNNIIKFYKK